MGDRYAFHVDWNDPSGYISWKYELLFFTKDNSLEIIDRHKNRAFLKKVVYPSVTLDQLFVGSTVTVYTRQLQITGFADEFTRRALGSGQEKTFAMVKPGAFKHFGKILNAIQKNGFTISQATMGQFTQEQARAFYAEHQGKPFFENLVAYMTSGPLVGLEMMSTGAVAKWRALLGPTNSHTARAEAPQSIRAVFGVDGTDNAAHGSDSAQSAAREAALFFGPRGVRPCGRADAGSSLCLVKPLALKSGSAGAIVDALQGRFQVTGLRLVSLDKTNVAEFLEVYKGVVPEYANMCDDLSSGPFIAVEVADRAGGDTVAALRELAGPADPEVARLLRPQSLRALFGTDKVRNGVHCTDLAEDGALEAHYFFKLMA